MKVFCRLIGLMCLVLASGCEKSDTSPGAEIKVIGHGGNGFQAYTNPYPSNSLLSVRKAIEGSGADGVEVDVQFTLDMEPVLYHDHRLESQTDCAGCIGLRNWEDIKDCRYKKDISAGQFENEILIRLEDVMKLFSGYNPKPLLFLDIKFITECGVSSYPEVAAGILAGITDQYAAWEWVVFETNNFDFLKELNSINENARIYYAGEINAATFEETIYQGVEGFVFHNDETSSDILQMISDHKKKIVLFGVKTQGGARRAVQKLPYAIYADNIELVKEYCR